MCMLTIDFDYVKAALPPRDPAGHKGDFGKVYVLGGQRGLHRCAGVLLPRRRPLRLRAGLSGRPVRHLAGGGGEVR